MRKNCLFLILLFLSAGMVYSAVKTDKTEKKDEKIKRTIAILPVVNQNNLAEYNYLIYTVRDALKAQLLQADQFLFASFSEIDNELTALNIKNQSVINEDKLNAIALKVKADVIVTGRFVIIADRIMIQMEAFDIFINQTVAGTTVKGDLGLDIFRIVDEVSVSMADKMAKKLTMVDKSYFNEMLKTQEEFLKKKQKLEKRLSFRLSKLNTAGVALTATGGTLLVSGIVLLVYDLGFYMDKVKPYYENGITDSSQYPEYETVYKTNAALLSIGITSLALGSVMTAIGIPFTVYNEKNKKVSIELTLTNGLNTAVSFKF